MTTLAVEGIGLAAPGLPGWTASLPVLQGVKPYRPQPLEAPKPALLPASERRRATMAARMVLQVGEEALQHNGINMNRLPCVFASASGELSIVDTLCRALGEPDRPVSPTQFHNSVHNAPAGYWSIATGSSASSVSLSAYDDSFGAGLLEAAVTATAEAMPVLLIAYDLAAPPPLQAKRPIAVPFAVALLLHPGAGSGRHPDIGLQRATDDGEGDSVLADPALEQLRRSNPAARSLPLLQALASRGNAPVRLPAGALTLAVRVRW